MLNTRTLWILAVAEMRSCRRLVRTWVFIVVAFLFCAVWYIDSVESTSWLSAPTASVGDDMTARYTISTMMNFFVVIFSAGVIFLAFDIRARDVQNRISDVVDSLPASNVEIILGRIAGILLLVLIPCVIFLVLITGYETVSEIVGSRFRLGVQPVSVMSLIAWNLVPSLIFYSALAACLAAFVRIRLLVAAVALGVLIGLFWLNNYIPVRFQEILSQYPGNALIPSDLAPTFTTPAILGNRCVVLLVSIALFLFAASVLPRSEPRRIVTTVSGISGLGLAIILFFVLIGAVYSTENLKEDWVIKHRMHSPASFPDIQDLTGNVELLPGRKVILDVTLTVHPPSERTTDSVVFSLNPDYKIQQIHIDGEQITNFGFEAGILELPSDLLPESSHELRVQAEGKPDHRFAYLDQARDLQTLPNIAVRQLGLQNSIFHNDFIALMPGVAWYPISGTLTDRDHLESRPRDLFTTDLTVIVPSTWQVATVGKRTVLDQQQRTKFRFRSGAPVPELALVASKFDQRVATVEGVEFEILFNKNHLQNLEALAPFNDRLQEWVAERIRNASAASLVYPYDVFYVVEVPSNLRIYGGGWRMDTVLQPPGMMLIRESAFPTERFESVIARERGYQWLSEERQDERAFNELLRYFGNDVQGGSPFAGFDQNFVSHQLSATQRGATALQFLLDQLSNQLVTQIESLSDLSIRDFNSYMPYLGVGQPTNARQMINWTPTQRRVQIAGLPSTWDLMDQAALFDLDFVGNPIQSYRVLLTKGRALARSMISYYGEEQIGEFLDHLLTKFRGQRITVSEFVQVASEVGLDFNEWVLSSLEDSVLPGYLVDSPSISSFEPQESGTNQYQTTFIIHNAESMSGFVRIFWTTTSNEDGRIRWPDENHSRSDPIFIKGLHSKRFAIRSETPVTGVWIEPFLAYNRDAIEVVIPKYNEFTDVKNPVLPFVADVDWRPTETAAIVVDDLDPRFSIVRRDVDSGNFIHTQSPSVSSNTNIVYLKGLPVGRFFDFNEWYREFDPSCFGHYLRTFTTIIRGDQQSAARFEVSLPHEGQWTLEYYVPRPALRNGGWYGIDTFFGFDSYRTRSADPNAPEEHYTLTIKDGDSDSDEEFDIANANVGWNDVGKFEFSSTEVEVLVSAWAGNEEVVVYVDAIRWTPIEPK